MGKNTDQKSQYYREYNLAEALSPEREPRQHQREALGDMEEWYNPEQSQGGILVLPTGGGKTFVATHFLCRHPLSDGYRILWLAHTHHLLGQALEAFDKTMSLVRRPNETVSIRVVSGATGHFQPAHIGSNDNILLCTLQTATRALEKKHPKFMKFLRAAKDGAGLFVVFDEAHHAPAPSYRRLLTDIRYICKPFGLLGLTATPTYSDERKRGWLKELFPDEIIHQTDAKTLMADKVLAKPILEDVYTNVKPEFNELDYRKWVSTNRDLPPHIIESLVKNEPRNDGIVAQYVSNEKKYGKTIMFADRRYQCDALREKLRKRGVSADVVYSYVAASPRGADVRNRRRTEDNAKVLEQFRNDELKVLINVQMLTEGIDVPDAQTVFLTRQTTSAILLNQMVGRVLRGPKFGGTKDAYIVSFIDDWQQHINWASHDQIWEGDMDDKQPKHNTRLPMRWISVELIRRLVRQMDSGLNINPAPYKTLIPIGWYLAKYDAVGYDDIDDGSSSKQQSTSRCILGMPVQVNFADDTEEKYGLVMVYDRDHDRLKHFISKLEDLYKHCALQDFERPDLTITEKLNIKLEEWRDDVYGVDSNRPGLEEVENLLVLARCVAQRGKGPAFIPFHEHKDHDLDTIAKCCTDQDLGPRAVDAILHREYTRDERLWQKIYRKYDHFKFAYDACVNRLLHAERHGSNLNNDRPTFTTPQNFPESEPSDEIKNEVKIRDQYSCLCCGSTNRRWLEVDHITPKSLSMDHRLENLQILCRLCNGQKGDDTIDFRIHRTMLTRKPDGLPDGRLPNPENAKMVCQWTRYLRRSVNLFYRCSAVEDINIGVRGKRLQIWTIRLFRGNDPNWLQPHLQELAKRIRKVRINAGLKAAPKRIEIICESTGQPYTKMR